MLYEQYLPLLTSLMESFHDVMLRQIDQMELVTCTDGRGQPLWVK